MPDQAQKISPFKSYILKSGGYKGGKSIAEAGKSQQKVYKLSSNENPIGTSPKALTALRERMDQFHIYPERTTRQFQEALVKYYQEELTADQFVVANSGSEVLELTIRAFLNEGLECITSSPCFSPYQMFSSWQGAKVVDVPLLEPDFRLDVEGILEAINSRTRLIFLTSPNNPTGTYIPKSALDYLINNVPEHVIMVLDEVYFHFAEAPDYTTALPYVQAGKNVIGVNSFSKTYGLAALRTGYAYSTPEIASYIRKICKPFILNALSAVAGMAALEDQEFVDQTVQTVHAGKKVLYQALDKLPVTYWKSQANFVLVKAHGEAVDLETQLLAEGLMVRNVGNFGAKGCVRITIGDEEATNALIKALQKVLT